MPENTQQFDLNDRLSLIESMIAEGRRGTESWGWSFVLWGAAYYVAIAWSTLGHSNLAWPVTMTATFLLTAIIASRQGGNQPGRTVSRAVSAVWIALGVSMFVLLLSLGISGHAEMHTSIAIVGGMLGMANATSSIILKWKMQFACAVVWWASAVAACFSNDTQTSIAFLVAIFFCQIVFGIYAMLCEASRNKQRGALHA